MRRDSALQAVGVPVPRVCLMDVTNEEVEAAQTLVAIKRTAYSNECDSMPCLQNVMPVMKRVIDVLDWEFKDGTVKKLILLKMVRALVKVKDDNVRYKFVLMQIHKYICSWEIHQVSMDEGFKIKEAQRYWRELMPTETYRV